MAAIEFRGKGLVFGAHHGIPMRALVQDTQASNLEQGQKPENFVVEGKQLDALKALSSRFAGAVSVVYAVPPYNTGSDGWRYDDEIQTPLTVEWAKGGPVGRDDADRHDKWLSWMTPRLRLIHELLADDGILFVSIDDNEGFRLKLLLDEIFGESNALPTLVWQKRYSVPSDVKGIGFTHENVLVYRKSERFAPQLVPQTEEQLERYNHVDPDGRRWKSADYTSRWTKQQRPNLYYAIKNPFTKKNVFPKETRVWAYSKEETAKNIAADLLWWGKDGTNSVPAFKNYAETLSEGMVPASLLLHEQVGHTQTAANELEEVLPGTKRDGKPLGLLRQLLWVAGHKDGIVLFPFASAGEGPHAVALANMAGDAGGGANRRFVVIVRDDGSEDVAVSRLRAVDKTVVSVPFGYFKLGTVVDAEALLRGTSLPSYEELARHVFFSATGRTLAGNVEQTLTGLIGSLDNTDVHLFYKPDPDYLKSNEAMLSAKTLKAIVDARQVGKKSIVFAAGKYLPHQDLASAGVEFCAFPAAIYRALVR
jgi:adenine-specific DNA-methyltransferase